MIAALFVKKNAKIPARHMLCTLETFGFCSLYYTSDPYVYNNNTTEGLKKKKKKKK